MGRILKYLTNIVNVMSVVVLAFVIWFIWQRYTKPGQEFSLFPKHEKLHAGAKLDIGLNYLASDRPTFFVALNKGCHYCQASAAFYEKVSQYNKAAKVVALFPNAVPDASDYLQQLNLKTDAMAVADYSKLGVSGTPTAILADSRGKILGVWLGLLDHTVQTEVLKRLGATDEEAYVPPFADTIALASITKPVTRESFTYAQVKEMRAQHKPFTLVDVRDRNQYGNGHLAGAINIPLDEFEVRGPHEVKKDNLLIVDCSYCSECELKQRSDGLPSLCTLSAQLIDEFGYRNLALVYDEEAGKLRLSAENEAGRGGLQ
jgi:thiol-disulfide isomerase/thioredoxin